MDLTIDNTALLELAAQKIADAAMYEDNSIMVMARKEITTRIDKIFVERAEAAVSAAIDNAVNAMSGRGRMKLSERASSSAGVRPSRRHWMACSITAPSARMRRSGSLR